MAKRKPSKKAARKKPATKRKAPTKKVSRRAKKKAPPLEQPPDPPGPERWVETQDAVAQAFSVSRRTVAEWISGGMPHGKRYDLLAIALWRLTKLREREGDADVAAAKRRKILAQAEQAEQDARKKRIASDIEERQAYRSDEIDLSASELILWIKAQLEGFPDSVRTQFGEEVATELDESIRQLLVRLTTWNPKAA